MKTQNEIVELTAAETEQVEGGIVFLGVPLACWAALEVAAVAGEILYLVHYR